MYSNAHLRGKTVLVSVLGQTALDCNGAFQCLLDAPKGYKKTISRVVYLSALKGLEERTQGPIVPAPKPLPSLVAESFQ